MNIALVSIYDQAYTPLGQLTWEQNKVKYAEMHDYAYCCKTSDFYGVQIGFEKIYFLRDLMNEYEDIDWFWWTGCDSLVTNFTIKVEDKIDNSYHFIIATDCNGINSDSFLIKNSKEGKEFINYILDQYPKYKTHHWFEQQAIIDSQSVFQNFFKIVPQRDLNSYNYELYPECIPKDKNGNDGQWQQGDWLIHWPGTSLPHRIQLAQYYSNFIVK